MIAEKASTAAAEREELKELIASMTEEQFQTFLASLALILPTVGKEIFCDE